MSELINGLDNWLDSRHQSDLDERVSELFGVDPGVGYAVEEEDMNDSNNEEKSTVPSSVLDSQRQPVDDREAVRVAAFTSWLNRNIIQGNKSMTIDERVAGLMLHYYREDKTTFAMLLRSQLTAVARDQRHACAEQCLALPNETITRTEAHNAVLNSTIK